MPPNPSARPRCAMARSPSRSLIFNQGESSGGWIRAAAEASTTVPRASASAGLPPLGIDADVGGEIEAADRQAEDPGAARDLGGVEHSHRALDDRNKGHVCRSPGGDDGAVTGADIVLVPRLGQHDAVDLLQRQRRQVHGPSRQ